MSFKATYIPYKQTGSFSKIVTDYLDHAAGLQPFYEEEASVNGIKNAIGRRKAFSTNRQLIVDVFSKQYESVEQTEAVKANIASLLSEDTFTICTAHQPNIFTGHLYFIYKILHAIKLADELNAAMPAFRFVPVYYMGSEDADLQELGEVTIHGKKYQWQTNQKGAVGRMVVDKAFLHLLDAVTAQLAVEEFGSEILNHIKTFYTAGKTIEQATFELVNFLFADYGLLVFLPDNALLKNEFSRISKMELLSQFSNKLVAETIGQFPAEYKVQAAGREINLFYLEDDSRERIHKDGSAFTIVNTGKTFNEAELIYEMDLHPERFSPNVILRPVFQELILPNIAFIGGGGELAYWLELKKVFEAVSVPYPVLVLRNSFMLVPSNVSVKMAALQFDAVDFFKQEKDLIEEIVKRESVLSLQLDEEKRSLRDVYEKIRQAAGAIDITLQQHTDALLTQAVKRIEKLESKMLKAEKKKFEAQQRQVTNIKEALFPGGTLQERVDNLLPYYAKWGKQLIPELYEFSTGLQQTFCILEEQN